MTFRLGLNYWPASSAMYWWRRFAADEVCRDFARIREAGFDTVRIFLLWEDFQPAPDEVSHRALDHLVSAANAARRSELALLPTLFTGHMSGVNWIPEWALEAGSASAEAPPPRFRVISGGRVVRAKLKNWYVDDLVLDAQARLAHEVAAALKDHASVWAWDLGNENSNCVVPPSRHAAVSWLERVASAIRSVDALRPITIGLHMEDLEEDRRLGPKEAACVCDFLSMHGYPIYAEWAHSPTDEMVLPFLGLLTRWLGGKDVLFEEFGAPAISRDHPGPARAAGENPLTLLDEEQAESYVLRSLEALHRFGFSGALIWCYTDYPESLWSEPPLDEATHERFFGQWRAAPDNSAQAKRAVAQLRRFAGLARREQAHDFSWIDIDSSEFYSNSREHLVRLYRKFRDSASHLIHA
jgi:endo-1,4-beta-mannosidase